MVERLTRKIGYEYEKAKRETQLLEINNKLGKLEDILEKYGVDIQNLDYILEDYSKNQGRYFAICEERDTLRQERDTWKRACELACDAMTKLGGDDCCGCRLDKKMCDICENKKALFDYFYQQAKKEGNDE